MRRRSHRRGALAANARFYSAAGLWTGAAGFTFSGDDIASSTNDAGIHMVNALTGDFDLDFTVVEQEIMGIGVYELGSHSNSSQAGMPVAAASWHLKGGGTGPGIHYGGSVQSARTTSYFEGNACSIRRRSGEFTLLVGGALDYTWSQTSVNPVYIGFGTSGNPGSVDIDDISWLI